MNDQIYAVYATDVDRDYLLGYATGLPKDIESAFEHRKAYGLRLEAIKPIAVTSETGNMIRELRKAKANTEAQLKHFESELAKLGVK